MQQAKWMTIKFSSRDLWIILAEIQLDSEKFSKQFLSRIYIYIENCKWEEEVGSSMYARWLYGRWMSKNCETGGTK